MQPYNPPTLQLVESFKYSTFTSFQLCIIIQQMEYLFDQSTLVHRMIELLDCWNKSTVYVYNKKNYSLNYATERFFRLFTFLDFCCCITTPDYSRYKPTHQAVTVVLSHVLLLPSRVVQKHQTHRHICDFTFYELINCYEINSLNSCCEMPVPRKWLCILRLNKSLD